MSSKLCSSEFYSRSSLPPLALKYPCKVSKVNLEFGRKVLQKGEGGRMDREREDFMELIAVVED